jgi:hypothetical protein
MRKPKTPASGRSDILLSLAVDLQICSSDCQGNFCAKFTLAVLIFNRRALRYYAPH